MTDFISGYNSFFDANKINMAKDFTFKQFHIQAKNCGMPVSTDAVLLGAWANIENAQTILDIGCGSGVLALMCAQRNRHAKITAIDIDADAINAARFNASQCPWSNRLTIIQSDIKEFTQHAEEVDAIICNPPYFNSGDVSHSKQRAVARHTQTLSHQHLLMFCYALIKEQGKVFFVLPYVEGNKLLNLIQHLQLSLTLLRLTEVKTTEKKAPSRLLLELVKKAPSTETQRSTLLINQGAEYSPEFIQLTRDFYLNM